MPSKILQKTKKSTKTRKSVTKKSTIRKNPVRKIIKKTRITRGGYGVAFNMNRSLIIPPKYQFDVETNINDVILIIENYCIDLSRVYSELYNKIKNSSNTNSSEIMKNFKKSQNLEHINLNNLSNVTIYSILYTLLNEPAIKNYNPNYEYGIFDKIINFSEKIKDLYPVPSLRVMLTKIIDLSMIGVEILKRGINFLRMNVYNGNSNSAFNSFISKGGNENIYQVFSQLLERFRSILAGNW